MIGLADFFDKQREQQLLWYNVTLLSDENKAKIVDELLLGLYEEVGELARACRQKPHIVRQERGGHGNSHEEIVDVLKYILAIADILGMTPEDIQARFIAKTMAVEQKVTQYRVDLEGRRAFVTDLDSCVADLTPFMIATGGMYGAANVGTLGTEARKAAWYAEGGFLTLPIMDGARKCILEAKDNGCLIAIITARPVWEHARIRADTIQWLKDMDIPVDIVLFNKDKWDALHQSVLPAQIIGFVEDRVKHIDELVSHHVKPVFLMDQPWNQEVSHPYVTRVTQWEQVAEAMRHINWGR